MQKLILVVDDEFDLAETMSELLQALGYSAKYATCLDEALSLLRSHRFDAVISDVHMPAGDGIRLRTMMLADERMKAIPFIYMTGKIAEIPSSAERYIEKPFSPDVLIPLLEEVLL